jgi:two-component system, cell cycle response regulator DivK
LGDYVPITILVVEDNPIAAEIARIALESRGYSVLLAPLGKLAVELMSENVCNLVLLDLMLPDADGAKLLEKLRRLPGGKDVPILAFSAFASRLDELRRTGADFDGYISKPVEPQDLIRIVDEHLSAKGRSHNSPPSAS